MSSVERGKLISIADYLAGEHRSSVKHEYLGGIVYAMAGARNLHNRIATNIGGLLYMRLRGKPCEPFNSDTKIRIELPTQTRFYYPDASVVCEPNPPEDTYQDKPLIVVEVISESTRRADEGEKQEAYLTLPSLAVYLLIEQDRPLIVVQRRVGNQFIREVVSGLDASLPLPEIGADVPLREIYEGVDLLDPGQ
jgi:Uma2 family endonuclease